jgi:hypothetical protein
MIPAGEIELTVPDPTTLTERTGRGANLAEIVSPETVKLQDSGVPPLGQLGVQLLSWCPAAAAAVRTIVGGGGDGRPGILMLVGRKFSEQSEGQSIPVPVTFPSPLTETFSVCDAAVAAATAIRIVAKLSALAIIHSSWAGVAPAYRWLSSRGQKAKPYLKRTDLLERSRTRRR